MHLRGFIPNVLLVLAHRPDELRAFMAYHDALMERDSGLTKGERELIVVATSARNRCFRSGEWAMGVSIPRTSTV